MKGVRLVGPKNDIFNMIGVKEYIQKICMIYS